MTIADEILREPHSWRPRDLIGRPSPLPREPGIYAWYFQRIPSGVPTRGCVRHAGAALLYLGIAPSHPGSRATLRTRLRTHLRGNASGSTLRFTLGCLLADDLGLRLRPVGRTGRLTFGDGEARLTEWIGENARLAWIVVPRPWAHESELIRRVSLPLNLQHNEHHPFAGELTMIRREARERARSLR